LGHVLDSVKMYHVQNPTHTWSFVFSFYSK